MEEKKKNNSRDTVLVSLLVVVAIMTFLGGYAISGELSERSFRASNTNNTKDEVISVPDDIVRGLPVPTIDTLGFKEGDVVSIEDEKYEVNFGRYVASSSSYYDIKYGDKTSIIKLVRHDSNGEFEEFLIDFSYDVVDVFVSSFGNTNKYDTIFFLLDDGSVEYILMRDAIANNDFTSYGTLPNISNIAKFYNGNVCDSEGNNCIKTVFVQSTDRSIYNLYDLIVK
ncbi:MAG: hypothetical protein IJ568_04480 [Bacilli bacterium]|nr:hypothetical protein [Bacilli bacterium]